MADYTPPEAELETASDIEAARREFLSNAPEIVQPEPEAPAVDDAALENAALDELTTPPAAPEGATTPASSAQPVPPAPTGDPFEAYGGKAAVEQAVGVQEALRTEAGIRALVANGLTALGYQPEQIRQALADPSTPAPTAPAAPEPADPFAGLEDDDLVDVGKVKGLLQSATDQAVAKALAQVQQQFAPVQEQQQAILREQQTQAIRTNTDNALVAILGPVPSDPEQAIAYRQQVDDIVNRANAYYDPNRWADPQHTQEIVQRAHAEIEADAERRFQAYLAGKRQARDSQPPNIGGGAGADGPLPEPKNLEEARTQARAGGFFD